MKKLMKLLTQNLSSYRILAKEVFDVLSSKYKLGRLNFIKTTKINFKLAQGSEPRLHIPIITNRFNYGYRQCREHLPADGSVRITNNTKYHNAFNGGEENRIHLVAYWTNHKFN